jgi:DNA (cytosine-5)-methyltransferase 3A
MEKQPINVLSLFDGISCGRLALQRAGIPVNQYFASEIDKHAIKVTQTNFPDTIQLGSVVDVKAENLPKIDLLLAGSPCQGFSLAGKQLNFEDPRSKLFFEFVRLLRECGPKYFLLENVKMKKEYENVITEILGVAPIKINSALVSAQNRERLYWTNIPNVNQPEDRGILLKDILEFSAGNKLDEVCVYPRGANDGGLNHYSGKSPCVTTSNWEHNIFAAQKIESNLEKLLATSKYKDSFQWRYDKKGRVLVMRPDGLKIQRIGRVANKNTKTEIITCLTQPYLNDGLLIRKITPIEAERLQTVPDNYTSCISDNKRYHALGNGWTVDVIAHILKNAEF